MDSTTLKLFRKLEQDIRDVNLRQGGPRGPKGRKGDSGNTGLTGLSGPHGTKGAKGVAGSRGPSGRDGLNGVGKVGPKGPSGPQGSSGAAGLHGSHGADGSDGVSVTDAKIDFDGHLTLQMSDGTEIDAGRIQMSSDGGDITYIAGGGLPDYWKDLVNGVIEDLANHLADFGNPHQVAHDQLIDSATSGEAWIDKHHPQFHDLESHTDVTIVSPKSNQGLFLLDDGVTWGNHAGFLESWPTGLASGGELNIGPGANDIEVITGFGVTANNYTNPLDPPLIQGLQWPQINEAITAAPAVAGSIVWFTIYDTGVAGLPLGNVPTNIGALHQYAQAPSPTLARQEIPLGFAVHNGVVWQEVSNPKVINQAAETLREVATTVLPLTTIIEGGTVTEQPAFMLDQEVGTVWENNRNWHVDKSDPNRETLPAVSPMVFEYVNRDFTVAGAPTSTVNPAIWDNAGVVEAVPLPANNTTIQRVYLDPANNYWILLGQTIYPNFLTAQANLPADNVVVPFLLQNSILLGYIIAERSKVDWDPNESVFNAAGSGAGAGGGGTPITEHDNLNGITPDNHHNQVHLLYGSDHSDVNIAAGLLQNDGLYWGGAEWFTGRRTRAVGDYVGGVDYQRGDEVFNGADLSEARIDGTNSYPFVAPTGETISVYQAIIGTDAKNAKQVVFGQRYTNATTPFFINGYRVYTIAGNQYDVTSIRDPLGVPITTQISSFEAISTGWLDLPLQPIPIAVGSVLDLVATVSEPDPTPIEVIASYDYQTPQNPVAPAVGQIIQGRSLPSVLSISYTDAIAGDRTALIQSLSIGDIIHLGQVEYSVQTNSDQTTYANLVVAPALTTTPIGIQDVTFETVAPTPITIGEDLGYWPTSAFPAVQGLLGVDIPYDTITPDTNAYGIDIFIQEAFIPDQTEWFLKVIASSGGSGSGGSFTPTTFTGAGTTGYVPDPVTESGRLLSDNGSWVAGGGGGGGQVDTVVGGTAITVDATDPVNPIVNNDPFTGAGTIGYVPNPGTNTGLYLEDDGTWSTPLNTTDHTLLSNIGTNTHVQIDSHIADGSIHFTEASINHTAIQNIGTNSHAAIDTHIADMTNPHNTTYANIGGTQPAPIAHTHPTSDIVSGTMADARIAQSNVTQHQAALSIAGSQLTGTIDGGTF